MAIYLYVVVRYYGQEHEYILPFSAKTHDAFFDREISSRRQFDHGLTAVRSMNRSAGDVMLTMSMPKIFE